MHHLPPGHSPLGGALAALGGAVHRLRRDSDGHELLARSAAIGYSGIAAVQHLDAELGAACEEPARDMLRPAARVDGHRHSWLLYEAVAGQPLDTTQPCTLPEFWEVVCTLTSALAHEHRRGRAHGRLESNCIWWDRGGRRVGLLGMVAAEHKHLANQLPATIDTAPELLLAERAEVGPAADVYSLGAIFFRLLTGQSAVQSSGHLAFDVAANPPLRLDERGVPRPLADLLARMLSKSPSARPRNAAAVLVELEAIRHGSTPLHLKLELRPSLLVGRELELQQLRELARSAEQGASVVVRVAGEPGVGKSHLLGTFIRAMSSGSKLVADAKFAQFHGARPYDALLVACANALSHALAGDDHLFAGARQRLAAADPTLLGVLAPDIPELEHFCGRLPVPPELVASANQQRFKRAARELLCQLCAPELPLILVLDDLQWADRATIGLLSELIEAGLPPYLQLILAYRETAAANNSDLRALFELTAAAPTIRLGLFSPNETEELCRLLVPDCGSLQPLASVVQERSHGNVLHCIELLRSFTISGEFVHALGHWKFVDGGNGLSQLSETVVDLIRGRLLRESASLQGLLAAAACIGRDFSAELLVIATARASSEVSEELRLACNRGFLVPSSARDKYVFSHDRVQQVALDLSDTESRAHAYLRLGRFYRTRTATALPCFYRWTT
jgi:hypothetical protein